MLLRIFKGTGPGVIFLIIITLITVWISAILNQRLHPRFIYETDPMPLYGFMKFLLHNNHSLGVILSFLIVSLMAFLMVNFNTSVFLMLAIIRIIDSYHKTGTAYNYFDAGILISTGSLFYANLIWFGLLVIIGIALLRTGNLKEIVISIIGLLTP